MGSGRRGGEQRGVADVEGATGWVRWGGGQLGGGDGEGATGRGDREVGKREGEKKGHEEGGISQKDMKCLGGHMECLGGTRLQSFFTLFTRATPGTPASIYIYIYGSE